MNRKRSITIVAVLLWITLVAGAAGLTHYYSRLPERISQHETILLGQSRLVPGSRAAMRILVRDSRDASPLEGAAVSLRLQPEQGGEAAALYNGKTNSDGSVEAEFAVPADLAGNYRLIVETKSELGSDRFEQSITLSREYRILLSTDKPLYQPGQVIHLRGLALATFDRKPAAGQELEITIADGKGNKVFRQKAVTSDYGAASIDFQLASEVNTGDYKITASLGETSSEKTVSVERYVLPKFDTRLAADRAYYQPGERVQMDLNADYFFGKPVSAGKVHIEGYTFDFQRNVTFSLDGETAEDGSFSFDFDLPDYVVGSDLESGMGRYYLQAAVTDQANHTEIAQISLPVAQTGLIIQAVPESGRIRQGVENILYVMASYPDGSPAETRLTIQIYDSGTVLHAETGPYGVAEAAYTPANPWQTMHITAEAANGAFAERDFTFEGDWSEEAIILRPEKPLYKVGEAMGLVILTSQQEGSAYLDIVREGQTVSTRSVPIHEGRGEVMVDLDENLYGTLELHAYKILSSGTIARDTRLVVVDAANDLQLAFNFDHDVYRPGDTAGLDIKVNGADGGGAQAVLGLAVVDESVFALAEQDPGFARLYFLLEQELLQPKFDLHGISLPDMVQKGPAVDPAFNRSQQGAAQAALAESAMLSTGFSLQANSHQEALNQAIQAQQKFFSGLSRGLMAAIILAALAACILVITALRRARRLTASLVVLLGAGYVLILVFWLFPLGAGSEWVRTAMDRLTFLIDRYAGGGLPTVTGLGLAGLAGLLVWGIAAFTRRDKSLGGLVVLIISFMVMLGLFIYAVDQGGRGFPEIAGTLLPLSLVMISVTILARAIGYAFQKKAVRALAGLLLAVSFVVGTVLLVGLTLSRTGGMFLDGGVVMEEVRGAAVFDRQLMALPGLAAMAPQPAPTATPEAQNAAGGPAKAGENSGSQVQAPRLRQYFPETMYWLPDAVTDPSGNLHLELPAADSITTWRLTALASTQDGRLGSGTAALKVFQDFFIDLDLPLSLTVGDEISIPVGIFNYLPDEQTLRLEIEPADWFELLDPAGQELTIAGNDVGVAYFRIRAKSFGRQAVKVTALGSQMSDAIQKEVQVYPDGKPVQFTYSDRINPEQPASQVVTVPVDAIPGTQKLVVKIYPGILSQVVEGLDSILRMPYGCFEQTSSTTYPNVLVLDYLRSTAQAAPEAEMKAEEYINLGYQRLTTFEVDGGGFSLFGDAPADRMLTAYGLQEFADMSRVTQVDRDLIDRAARWLIASQMSDGSWENDQGLVHESTWSSLGNDRLPVTAYIVWSLTDAGYADDAGTQRGLDYLREFQSKAEDPYVTALLANALVAADLEGEGKISEVTQAVLDRLAAQAEQTGSGAVWNSKVATFMGSEGEVGSIETTALAAYVFLRANSHTDLANAALVALIQQKDSFGNWHSTQATVLALKALLQSVRAGAENIDARVQVSLNGGQEHELTVDAGNFDVVQLLAFDDIQPGSENTIAISAAGSGNLMYQVTGEYYLPWDKLALYPETQTPDLAVIDVSYDRTELEVNDTVTVKSARVFA